MPDFPDLESQLRAMADRLDDGVAPVRAEDVTVADMTAPARQPSRSGAGRAVVAVVAIAAVGLGAVVLANRTSDSAPTHASSEASTTTAPRPAPPSWTDQLTRCAPRSDRQVVTETEAGVRVEITHSIQPNADRLSDWTATVTNLTDHTLSIEKHQESAAATTADGQLVSSGIYLTYGIPDAQVKPNESSTLPVTIGTRTCDHGGEFLLPAGTYTFVVPVEVDGRSVRSNPFLVDVAPNGDTRLHGGPPTGAFDSTERTTGAERCGQPTPSPTTEAGVSATLTAHATGPWGVALRNVGASSVTSWSYDPPLKGVPPTIRTVDAVLVRDGKVVAVVLARPQTIGRLPALPTGTSWDANVIVAMRPCDDFTRPVPAGNYSLVALVDINDSTMSSTPLAVTVDDAGALKQSSQWRATKMCLFEHTDPSTLREPITITLPGRQPTPIVPGDPITRPDAVTLDGDGSTDPGNPGYAQGASTLLWGATSPGGPFEHLDRVQPIAIEPDEEVVLQQSGDSTCVQRWRVVILAATPLPSDHSAGTRLVLVGFKPGAEGNGPAATVYIYAVPAGTQ